MSNLLMRILSALFLVPLVLALLFYSSVPIFVTAIAALAGISGYEFGTITFNRNMKVHILLVVLFSCAFSLSVSLYQSFPSLLLLSLTFLIGVNIAISMFLNIPFDISIRNLAFSLFGAIYCGVLFGFLGLIFSAHYPDGKHWLLLLLLGTFLGDTGAYAFGRLFGKRKLAPRLSPGKTWAGAFGGLLCTSASILIVKIFLIPQISWLSFVIFSVVLSFFLPAR